MKRSLDDGNIVHFYENAAGKYDTVRFLSYQGCYTDLEQKGIVLSMIKNNDIKRILDLGCGTGRFSVQLANLGINVVAADPSFTMLKQVELKDVTHKINLVNANGYTLPFKDNSFDACVCVNVINHVINYEDIIREINRILSDDGFMVMNFANSMGFYLPVSLYVNSFHKSLQENIYTKWFNYFEIKNILADCGFEINEIMGFIVFPRRTIPEWSFKFLKELDQYCRNTVLKYLSGSLFIKAQKIS